MLHQTKMLECRIYASQTKILEGWTKDVMRIFEPLFKGASTLFGLRFREIYPSQTKILEGRTNLSECVFEALFKGVNARFRRRNVEKCFENAFWKVCQAFQNLRLGSIKFIRKSAFHLLFILPKSSFGDHRIGKRILKGWIFDWLFNGS